MASTTVDSPAPAPHPPDRLTIDSIPTVDLRLLSQSELTALSLCSSRTFDLRRRDDVVFPQIDRSVFNESAGSRKQTYSRLRLSPRRPDPKARPRPTLGPLGVERAENSRIISLFKDLFYSGNAGVGDGGGGGERKRKRGRKPKCLTENNSLALAVVEEREKYEVATPAGVRVEGEVWDEMERELVNKNGVVVNLRELAMAEDPFGPELRRRTEGKETPEELLGFITDLNGQWGSRRKKRKIVDANEFGDVLPNGWKVLIAMKKRAGHAWVFCRRYVSPAGRYFVSCKEVSSYLLSLTSPQDLKLQSSSQCIADSVVENKPASGNVVGAGAAIADPSLYVALQCNDYENQQKQTCTSQTVDHGKQVILSNNVHLGEVKAVSALKCHKCSTPFGEKGELLNHLLSCHKRKRRKSGEPVEDDVLMKDGKYECQFCERTFLERSSYFGHVGNHVKSYAKSMGGSPSVTAKQNPWDLVSVGGAPLTVSETPVSVEVNRESVAGTPNIQTSGEPNLTSVDSKVKVASDAETHSDNCDNDQNNLVLHSELNMEAAQNSKGSTDGSSDKQDEIFHPSDIEAREVDKPAGISVVEPGLCAGDGKMSSNTENNDVFRSYAEINASESVGPGISGSAAVPEGDAETCVPADSNQLDHGNDGNGNFVAVSTVESKGTASENILPATNKSSPSSDQDFLDGSVGNKNLEHSFHDEGAEAGNNDELMVESGSRHLDIDMDATNGSQHSGNLEECSGVSREEEKTCGITANKIEYTASTLADSKVERNSETCSPSGGQYMIGTPNDVKDVFSGLVNETEVDLCSLGKGEVVDVNHYIDQERQTESTGLLVSKNDDRNYFQDDSVKVPAVTGMEPQGTGASQDELACSPEDNMRELSNRVDAEPKCAAVDNSSSLFFISGSTDTPLDADVMAKNEQEKISSICSHIPSGSVKTQSDISDVLGSYSFIDNKQEQDPKNIISGLSINEHIDEDTVDNVTNASAATTTMKLPEIAKDENLQANKLILDFGSMTEINARFSNSDEHETVPEGSSPFSLWGEQICVEDNQTRAYDGARGLEPERASSNNSLNLFGLQQSCDLGYNLNKVCMNEQRFAVQHNEIGFFNRSNDGGEGISRGNTLNSAGLQQQFDAAYNLNKPCLDQQSFGVQHNQTGAYSTSDEARRERVAYGNSLSLASVQQTCDTGYGLNKASTQQTCDTGYGLNKASTQQTCDTGYTLNKASTQQTCDTGYTLNKASTKQACETGYSLNKGYIGPVQGFTKLDGLEHSRDSHLMIGFGNSSSRPNQSVATEFLWRTTEGNIQQGGLVDSSSSQGQSTGSFQAFDFLSDKGGNNMYPRNEKFDMSSFEGLGSTSVEPMEFSFLTTQNPNPQLEDPKMLASYNGEMDQGFGSSVWHQKGTSLPNMIGAQVVTTLCVWCGNEFHQDSLSCEVQAGSIGYLCPACKARMSGQFL